MNSRPFAYNPTLTPIPGTDQVGTLAIGVSQQDYSKNPGGVKWWNGPDEELGYIICEPVASGNFPTPIGNIGTVKFWRSVELTTESFLEITNLVFNQNFTTGANAKTWLNSNGYWTSWSNTFKYNTNLLSWPSSTTGYTLYSGNFTSVDDGHNDTNITIPSFSMSNSASTLLYVCTNGYITLGSPSDDVPRTTPQSLVGMIAGNPDDNWLEKGLVMVDGDTENLYYQSFVDDIFSGTKILVYSESFPPSYLDPFTSIPTSYILNIYRDSTYQWIETRIKSNPKGKAGPYNSTDVSVQASTVSNVWRGDLNGENWVYMGTGSVSRV